MFTVPPAVALLDYISSGLLWRIFFPNWDISRGFHYMSLISQNTPRNCDFSRLFSNIFYSPESQRSCDARGGCRGTLYFIASVPSGRITPYVAIFRGFLLYGILYSKLRWAGRGAHRPVLRVFGPKKTGAHSAREAKPTNFKIFFFIVSQIW